VVRVSEPHEKISVVEVKAAITQVKNNKAAGFSGVVSVMLKVSWRSVQSGWLTYSMQLLGRSRVDG